MMTLFDASVFLIFFILAGRVLEAYAKTRVSHPTSRCFASTRLLTSTASLPLRPGTRLPCSAPSDPTPPSLSPPTLCLLPPLPPLKSTNFQKWTPPRLLLLKPQPSPSPHLRLPLLSALLPPSPFPHPTSTSPISFSFNLGPFLRATVQSSPARRRLTSRPSRASPNLSRRGRGTRSSRGRST